MHGSADVRVRRWAGPLLFSAVVAGGTLAVLGWRMAPRTAPPTRPTHPSAGAETIAQLPSVLQIPPLPSTVRVGILHDTASDRYFDSRGVLDTVLETWRVAIAEAGANARVVTPQEALAARQLQVLVVPATPCLGRDARHAIDEMTRRSGGVVVTWLSGVRDGGCKGVGFGLVTTASGAARADTLSLVRSDAYVTLLGDGPLTAGVPPGSRLELLVDNHVALRLPAREAYYSDFTLNPRAARETELLDGALATTTTPNGSRTVYWGFDLTRIARSPWNHELARILTRNTIAWAAGQPSARVLPWPNGHRAAAVLAQDVEDEFANAQFAMDSLHAAGVRGTYFLVSQLATRNAKLARALAQQGEVGSHSPRHQTLDGVPAEEQKARLARTQEQLESVLGHRVAGFRPPQELFDKTTLVEWVANGGQYLFGSNNARTASPEIIDVGGRRLVLFGRVTNDDFISVKRAGHLNVQLLARDYTADLDKVCALGGLYILSYHSQLLSRPELVPALAIFARRVRSDSTVWSTTAGDVADWWLARAGLQVSIAREAGGRLRLHAANVGTNSVRDAVAEIVDHRTSGGGTIRARVPLPLIPAGGAFDTTIVLGDDRYALGGANAR